MIGLARRLAISLLVPLSLVAWPARAQDAESLRGKRVAAVLVVGPSAEATAELTRFLEVRKGDRYSPRKVRRTIEVLAKLGNYRTIVVEASDTADGVVLTIRLDPLPRVRKIELHGVTGSRQRVLGALTVSVGDPLIGGDATLERMEEDIREAYRLAGWRDAEAEVSLRPTGQGDVVLECRVDEGRRMRIQSIDFEGSDDYQDTFTEEALAKETGLQIGDAASRAALEEGADRVVSYLKKLGFREARITGYRAQKDDVTGDARVAYALLLGDRISVIFDKRAIAWDDQKRDLFWFWHFKDSSLLQLLDLDNESTFTEGFALEAAEKLEGYYQRRGYLETEVRPTFETDRAKRLKTFRFRIRPGRRFRLTDVTFRGLEAYPEEIGQKALLRELYGISKPLEEKHYVPDEVDAALYHVTNYIRSRGYDAARIDADEPEIDPVKRTVALAFEVTPGPRSVVGTIEFQGNREVPENKLRDVIAKEPVRLEEGAPLNAVYLDYGDEAIEEYYASIGFPYANARHELELRPRVASTGAAPADAGPGATGTNGRDEVSGGDEESGAAVPAPPEQNVVDVDYQIDESFQAYIGRVIVRGNRHTNREAIERVLPFKTGDTYSPKSLEAGQQALYRLGPFARVSVVPTEQGEPEVVRDVLVAVAEADRMFLEPSVGVSWPEQGPRVGLRGGHRNLFGNGESLSLRWSANWRWRGLLGDTEGVTQVAPAADYEQIETRLLLTYAQPTTFGFPVNGSITASLFERERNRAYGYTGNRIVGAADQKLDFEVPVLRDADVRLIGRYQMFVRDMQYRSLDQESAVVLVKEDVNFPIGDMFDYPLKWKVAVASLGTLIDGRDDRVNPGSGYTFSFSGEVADEWIASDADYMRFLGSWTLFRPAPLRSRVVLSLRGGLAYPLGRSSGIPVDQRFHLGGTGSVRGFTQSDIGPKFSSVGDDEDVAISAGGDASASYALELRHRLLGGFDWVVFTDGGWLRVDHRDPEPLLRAAVRSRPDGDELVRGRLRQQSQIATSVGIGLRVRTAVGPIKFDLAADTDKLEKLDSTRGVQENVLIHFTIGDF